MRYFLSFMLLAGCSAFAADTDINGRWDISYPGSAGRASWLEVQGAGTPSPQAKFVSAYSGDLNIANEVSIKDGELTLVFATKQRRQPGEEPVTVRFVYKARLNGAQLVGTSETEGSTSPATKWVGVRAPEIKDKDDGTWGEGKPVQLFNGKDLTGWEALQKERKFGWTVAAGVLRAPGGSGSADLVSTAKFWNFKLHIEFKTAKGSNSGVGLRGRYEIQILDDYGLPPNTHSNGSLYSRIAPSVNASKPPDEWQAYDITLIGRDLTVVLNGKKILDKVTVEGLTAMGHDPNEGEPGPFSLQGDHGSIEFRNVMLTPLVK